MADQLSYVVTGIEKAPAMVFLHGFLGASSDWEEVMAGLKDRHRCIAVDLPGHGGSVGLARELYTMDGACRLIVETLRACGEESAMVVGYSMGGRLALYLALHYPDVCRRLVLESASPGLAGEDERMERRGVDEARAMRLESDDFKEFLRDWYDQPLFASLARREGLEEEVMERRRRNDPLELARALRGMGTGVQPSLWGRLSELRVPTLVVAGVLDGKFAEIALRMGVLMPSVRTAIIPNAGHNIHAERPAIFVEVLRDFIERPA